MTTSSDRLSAKTVVLGGGPTSLAVVRCLSDASIDPTVIGIGDADDCRYSRCCRFVDYGLGTPFDIKFTDWLIAEFGSVTDPSVLIPTSDASALFIAKHSADLRQHFRFWGNSFDSLKCIVSKDELYASAMSAGILVPPYVVSPSPDDLRSWVHRYDGPYIVKPFFVADPSSPIAEKNISLPDRRAAMAFADQFTLRSLVIQQKLRGGDGRIYDCYGLCDNNGNVVCLADHLRIRQTRDGAGVTSYGEIPVRTAPFPKEAICSNTRELFASLKYHGIFGVEWLWDVRTESLYLIDVNARPFTSVGHLCDSGLNLPARAVEELTGTLDLSSVTRLIHTYWIDLSGDVRSAAQHIRSGELTFYQWLRDIARTRSFSRWRLSDPLPALVSFGKLLFVLADSMLRKFRHKSRG